MKIRDWLRKAERHRRTIVRVEERSAEERRRAQVAVDARHGILPLCGRRPGSGDGDGE